MQRVGVAVVSVVVALALPRVCHAQRTLTGNDFAIDFHRGPVTGSGRAVGLGGAYSSLVEGVDGAVANPAAYGLRSPDDIAWFSPSFVAGLNFPQQHWDNSGPSSVQYDRFYILDLGAGAALGDFGLGYLWDLQNYTLRQGLDRPVAVGLALHHVGGGYQVHHGEIGVGVGFRFGAMSISSAGGFLDTTFNPLISYFGSAPEMGIVWRPPLWPFRVAGSYRAEVVAVTPEVNGSGSVVRRPDGCTAGTSGCFVVPRSVNIPWELQFGVSVMLGERWFNPPWEDPHAAEDHLRERQLRSRAARAAAFARTLSEAGTPEDRAAAIALWHASEPARQQREDAEYRTFGWRFRAERRARVRDRPRRYVLLSADVVFYGATARGQGIESFLGQVDRPSGRAPVISPRFGIESEPWANRLQVRLGTYIEPSRFANVSSRWHVTGGFDLRLFRWHALKLVDAFDIKLSATVDISDNYDDFGVSVGIWH